MTTRRSERLRRKGARQSTTPGLTRPAAFTLYGSSYVCESEASFATSSAAKLPPDSRRARYMESPHCLVETSDEIPDTPKRRPSWLNAATRLSLTPAVETPRKMARAVREYAVRHHNNSHSLFLLAAIAAVGALVLFSIYAQKTSTPLPSPAVAAQASNDYFNEFKSSVSSVASNARSKIGTFVEFAFGGAWSRRTRVITFAEWEDIMAPRILEEARKIAREESASDNAFRAHREKYAADKGLPADYALGSAGGAVLWTIPSSASQYAQFAKQYLVSLVSSGHAHIPQSPSVMLQTKVTPGECWWFTGGQGTVVIRLARPIIPTHVTIEHTPNGTTSAPKNIRISVVPHSAKTSNISAWRHAGDIIYNINGEHMQTSSIEPPLVIARAVVFEILNNHGGNFTCVYRLRVHGDVSA